VENMLFSLYTKRTCMFQYTSKPYLLINCPEPPDDGCRIELFSSYDNVSATVE